MAFLTQAPTFTSDFLPKRFGLKFDPPTIVLEYLVPSTGKLYHHKMTLKNLAPDDDPEEVLDYLKRKHGTYINTSKVAEEQILSLISKLQERIEDEEIGHFVRGDSREGRNYAAYQDELRKDLIQNDFGNWDSSDEEEIRL